MIQVGEYYYNPKYQRIFLVRELSDEGFVCSDGQAFFDDCHTTKGEIVVTERFFINCERVVRDEMWRYDYITFTTTVNHWMVGSLDIREQMRFSAKYMDDLLNGQIKGLIRTYLNPKMEFDTI
jgi:hypothetical protein